MTGRRRWGYGEEAVQDNPGKCKEQGVQGTEDGVLWEGRRPSRAEGGHRGRKGFDAWIGSKLCRVLEAREGSLGQVIEISDR